MFSGSSDQIRSRQGYAELASLIPLGPSGNLDPRASHDRPTAYHGYRAGDLCLEGTWAIGRSRKHAAALTPLREGDGG